MKNPNEIWLRKNNLMSKGISFNDMVHSSVLIIKVIYLEQGE